jgi:hypothetical protein
MGSKNEREKHSNSYWRHHSRQGGGVSGKEVMPPKKKPEAPAPAAHESGTHGGDTEREMKGEREVARIQVENARQTRGSPVR